MYKEKFLHNFLAKNRSNLIEILVHFPLNFHNFFCAAKKVHLWLLSNYVHLCMLATIYNLI